MKRSLTQQIDVETVSPQKLVVVDVDEKAIAEWCLELCLLQRKPDED